MSTGSVALGVAAAAIAVLAAALRRGPAPADALLDERQHRLAELRARYFNDVGDSAGF